MLFTKLKSHENLHQKVNYFETTLILNEDETAITDLEGEELYLATMDPYGNEVFVSPEQLSLNITPLNWIEVKVCQKFDMTGACLCHTKKRICL